MQNETYLEDKTLALLSDESDLVFKVGAITIDVITVWY
jgi:hypothetical protein